MHYNVDYAAEQKRLASANSRQLVPYNGIVFRLYVTTASPNSLKPRYGHPIKTTTVETE